MTTFWIVAGFLIAGALLFIIPPLFQRTPKKSGVNRVAANISVYQDQFAELDADLKNGVITPEQYQQGREELQRRLLQDIPAAADAAAAPQPPARGGRAVAIALGVILPVVAVLLYLLLGSPMALQSEQQAAMPPGHAGGQLDPQQIEMMVTGLAARLEQNPEDVEGWIMLARSYTALGRFSDASRAFAKVTALVPNDAQLWADYADILAMASGKSLQGKPVELINKALQIDPNNHKALALAGSAEFEAKNYSRAVSYWERLQKLLPSDSQGLRAVAASIAEARALASGASAAEANAAAARAAGVAGGEPAAGNGTGIVSGVVSLNPQLAGKVAPTDALFIFARAVEGPKMPVAILRLQAKDLPASFTLDDSMAMNPAMKLSNFKEVVVGARVSKSGNATPQPGDLQGASTAIKIGSTGVKVVIDKAVP